MGRVYPAVDLADEVARLATAALAEVRLGQLFSVAARTGVDDEPLQSS